MQNQIQSGRKAIENRQQENHNHNAPNNQIQKVQPSLCIALLGCFGGLMVQLVIGSLYQWGIINIYVTSYYKLTEPELKLENNGVVFPSMMICIGLTMRIGLFFCEITHPAFVIFLNQVLSAGVIFASSYMQNFMGFILLYGIAFGLIAGLSFMIPIVECNKYFPGKKMIFNGIILIGTGMGSVVFGLFSYNFLNPNKFTPISGYYNGSQQLQNIARKVPECIKFLSLLYLIIGSIGAIMLLPVMIANRRKQNQQKLKKAQLSAKKQEQAQQNGQIQNQPQKQVEIVGEPSSYTAAICSRYWWIEVCILIFGSSGVFLINGNYKTYVKQTISNDQFLTLVGVIGSIGNGGSRFFWNLLFSKTGFKTVMLLNLGINIFVFSTIRFTVKIEFLYLIYVFLINCCLGGFLVMTPTFLQALLGPRVGSNIYGFFWQLFAIANFISYAYVAGLSQMITFDGIIYIVLGMCVLAIPFVVLPTFQGQWKNDIKDLQYCSCCIQNKGQQMEPYAHRNAENLQQQLNASNNAINQFQSTVNVQVPYRKIKLEPIAANKSD